jgi:hypothetical protein
MSNTIYSETNMFDFAYHIAPNAMSAAFSGSKNIQGKSIDEYIAAELEKWEGDEDETN